MAAAPSSLDNYMSCQICFENFEENGDHVPRILPCHHTVCEQCIKGMIRGNNLICPECREEHEAKKREKSFTQNKYILVQMSRTKKSEKEHVSKVDICPKHGKEIIFFCVEEGCKKFICKTCLAKEHVRHYVVEIEEKKKEELLKNIESTKKNLAHKIAILSQAKDDVIEKTKVTVKELKKAKKETNRNFDIMIEEAQKNLRDTSTSLDGDVGMINENILLLEQMKSNISSEREVTIECLTDLEQTVAEVINTIKVNICGNRTFIFKTFQANKSTNYGRFEEATITVVLPDMTVVEEPSAPGKTLPIVTDASKLIWKVINTVNSKLPGDCHLAALTNGSVVITGRQDLHWTLKQFNMNDKIEMSREKLKEELHGLCEIHLGGRAAMAISYGQEHKIEFRSLGDLGQIIHSYSTGSLKPAAMCAACPSTLLFVDRSNMPSEIYWLDCSGDKPKLSGKKINTTLNFIWDICYIQDEKKPLLVGGNSENTIVYNVVNSKLECDSNAFGNSVTTDVCNYIMVCRNNNIRMLSLSDGKDLGCLVREGDQGFGRSWCVRWCNTTSSLVVAHYLNKEYHISTIQFE